VPDIPDIETVLRPIAENFIAERVGYADVMPDYNAPLLAKVKRLFADAEFLPVKHETILSRWRRRRR